ncbi:MAG: beta-agarase [Planctomycetota bacterium]
MFKNLSKSSCVVLAVVLLCFSIRPTSSFADKPVVITVEPTVTRQIGGISEVDRDVYFGLCDPGKGFDRRARSAERMRYLLDELNITFGRSLGPVMAVTKWGGGVFEDPARPGFADLEKLKAVLRADQPGSDFKTLVGERLDIAAHGNHNAFPEFMGKYYTDSAKTANKPEFIPQNIEAAAELSAMVMAHNYTDFDRPAYYEPLNEPHWSYVSTQQLADWHVATKKKVQELSPDVQVGGPCLSVAYFYKRDYAAGDSLLNFMKNTGNQLDFYSFHVYDYMGWDGERVNGRVTSGLPLEGILDHVQGLSVQEFGSEFDVVISEHGGYFLNRGGVPADDAIAAEFLSLSDSFEDTMKKRSITSHVLVSSAITNTLSFMDHPHTVKKAVPFILLESMAWDPKYYSTLYTPYGFEDKDRWVESRNIDFYKFFRDLSGRRVKTSGVSADVQARAFVEGDTLRVVLNNLSDDPEHIALDLPASGGRIGVRRYGRNPDYTPYLEEGQLESLDNIEIKGREAVLVTVAYDEPIQTLETMNEVAHYSTQNAVKVEPGKISRLDVKLPNPEGVAYATLRLGVSRPGDASPEVVVSFNGKRLKVPAEDSAARFANSEEYATTKIIEIDPSLLKQNNAVRVAFPDGKGGGVGSAVIRAGYVQ